MLDVATSLLVLTALLAVLNERLLGLPPTIGLMAIALALSLGLVGLDALGVAQSLHAREVALLQSIDFSQLLMQGTLSLLLFAGALHVDARMLRAHGWQVGWLAFAGTAVSTALVGAGTWLLLRLLGQPLPVLPCLLFGAIVSPTDPIAVLGMLKSAGAPRNLGAVIAGESLFNDGVGVVLFTLLLGAWEGRAVPTAADAALLLLRQAGGGLAFGAVLGAVTVALLRRIGQARVAVLLTLAAVMGGYALANHLEVSGPLAMVVAGLAVGAARVPGRVELDLFWELVDEMLNAVLFVLVGMEVIAIRPPAPGPAAALAGAGVIVIALLARALSVGLPVRLGRRAFGLPAGSARALTWGGLRGGISVALALSLPATAHRETFLALTYAIVAFSILVQGLTFGPLVRASGLTCQNPGSDSTNDAPEVCIGAEGSHHHHR